MATAAAIKDISDVDAQRKERVKARWSMLRRALLGSTPGASATTTPVGDSDRTIKSEGGPAHREDEHSMNYFPGFGVIERSILLETDVPKFSNNNDESNGGQDNDDISGSEWDFVLSSYTSQKGHIIQFLTRETKQQHQNNLQQQNVEKPLSVKERVEALLSHRNYGVDNTGNVRVWDAEATLAGFLLSILFDGDEFHLQMEGGDKPETISQLRHDLRSILVSTGMEENLTQQSLSGGNNFCNLLELGAGQAGLAGLALAAAYSSLPEEGGDNNARIDMKPLQVILTDGHPKCVSNNAVCARLSPNTTSMVTAKLLLWDSSQNGARACNDIMKEIAQKSNTPSKDKSSCLAKPILENGGVGSFHLCLASDCVHFQEFHDGLFATIARTLAIGGIALLCQPRRGSSLANFMALVNAVNSGNGVEGNQDPLFEMGLVENFHPKVSKKHQELVLEKENASNVSGGATHSQVSQSYDPNWHRPLLIVLKKLRRYDEELDGDRARHHFVVLKARPPIV